MSYSVGSLIRKGKKATSDGDVIANLRAAGGIPLLASNTPEYCVSWETFNFVTGRTLNPHNLRRTPGGSSGGEVIKSYIYTYELFSDYITYNIRLI